MAKENKSEKYLALKQELTRTLADLNVARLKISDLKSLIEVSSLINSSIDSHELLETIVRQAKKVIDAEGVALLRSNMEETELSFEAVATSRGMIFDPHLKIKVREGVSGWVAFHKLPVYVPDITKDSRFEDYSTKDLGLDVRSVLAVPMIYRGKLLGVLEAVNISLKRFVPKEAIELFTFYANEAAVAISNAQLFSEFKILFVNTVRSLSQALEAKDQYTSGHAQRVSHFAMVIARELNLPRNERESIELSALLHDIGKIGVPEDILTKPAKVTEEEFEEIKKHPLHGLKILEPLEQLDKVLPGIMHHHERWDGDGYPDGLKGEEIPLAARIVGVIDALDAMTSDRPYRKALPDEEALKRLKECAGTQFDSMVVDALVRAYERGEIITANQKNKAA